MKKPILIALCCAGLMLVTPLTSIAQENKVSINLIEHPDINSLVAQIRVVIDEILQRYWHMPMVRNLCNAILNTLGMIGKIIFCISFIMLIVLWFLLTVIYYEIENHWPPDSNYTLLILYFFFKDKCSYSNSFINSKFSYKFQYVSTEIKNISEFVNDCPCLQE